MFITHPGIRKVSVEGCALEAGEGVYGEPGGGGYSGPGGDIRPYRSSRSTA